MDGVAFSSTFGGPCRLVHCFQPKGHQPTEIVSRAAVERWLTKKVSLIYRVLKREPGFRKSRFHFEYWTCGSFALDALELLSKFAERTKKCAIGWKDGVAVRAYVGRVKLRSVAQMLDQHFFQHPIAIFEKRHEMAAKLPKTVDPTVDQDMRRDATASFL